MAAQGYAMRGDAIELMQPKMFAAPREAPDWRV